MARCNAELTTIAWWQEHLREAATSPVAAASGQSGDRKQELREVAWSGEMLAANPGGRQKHQQLGQATMRTITCKLQTTIIAYRLQRIGNTSENYLSWNNRECLLSMCI
jgi:hypothetical protein